jgi:hypothetical protein
MPWLEGVRPDLVGRYEQLYARRAGYLASEAQREHARVVREAVERHGGLARPPGRWRRSDALDLRDDAPGASPSPAPQLELGV